MGIANSSKIKNECIKCKDILKIKPKEKKNLKIDLDHHWYWNGKTNPFDSKEEQMWCPYDITDSLQIETAFKKNLSSITIGDYIIDLEKFIQFHKIDKWRQRHIIRGLSDQSNIMRNNRFSSFADFEPISTNLCINSLQMISINEVFSCIFTEDQNDKTMLSFYNSSFIIDSQFKQWIFKYYLNYLKEHNNNKKEELNIEKIQCVINHDLELFEWFNKGKENIQIESYRGYLENINAKNICSQIIKMYTEEGFLYGQLNRMLRSFSTQKFNENSFKNCPFIFYMFLLMFSIKFYSEDNENYNKNDCIMVYRGFNIPQRELDTFIDKHKKNAYFILPEFVSTSKNVKIAKLFASKDCPEENVQILYKITAEKTKSFYYTLKSSEISNSSKFKKEKEVLFNPFNIFKIVNLIKTGKEIVIELNACGNIFADLDEYLFQDEEGVGNKIVPQFKTGDYENWIIYSGGFVLEINRKLYELEEIADKMKKLQKIVYFGRGALNEEEVGRLIRIIEKFEGLIEIQIDELDINISLETIKKFGEELLKKKKFKTLIIRNFFEFKEERLKVFEKFLDKMNNEKVEKQMEIILELEMKSIIMRSRGRFIINKLCGKIIETNKNLIMLKKLDISDNKIGVEGTKVLAAVLKHMPSLESIELYWNIIGLEGSISLAKALKNVPNLKTFDNGGNSSRIRGGNYIYAEGAEALGKAMKDLPNLQNLNLSWNYIGDEGAKALALEFKNIKNLQNLNLKFNKISIEGAKAIASEIKHITKLENLNLGGNNIDNDFAIAIGMSLKHIPNLKYLNLRGSKIGLEGVKTLASQLKYVSKLQNLSLRGNNIDNEGAIVLGSSLKYIPNLQNLNFRGNHIGVEGVKTLALELKNLPNLKNLNLRENNYDNEGLEGLVMQIDLNLNFQGKNITF